ncbi:hypothetical protein GGF31_002213 [Allomyces arbusculus]|nr:hypothetical protein GGF31_002213 [Allomyces arbusculus]
MPIFVRVSHDETTFSTNDGKTTIWHLDSTFGMVYKNKGQDIMISAFVCECHGLTSLPEHPAEKLRDFEGEQVLRDDETHVLDVHISFIYGKNKDGYWSG